MPPQPQDPRRASAPDAHAHANESERKDKVKSRIAYTRSTTFDQALPRVKDVSSWKENAPSRTGPRINIQETHNASGREASYRALDRSDGLEHVTSARVERSKSKQSRTQRKPSQSSPINVVVIGADSVDRHAFVRNAMGVSSRSGTRATECNVPVDGRVHHVRIFELPIQEVSVDDEEIVEWPASIEEQIDGALTLINVTDGTSFENVPDVLNAISKADLPSVLVSTKCDAPHARRQMDVDAIEKRAKKTIGNLGTVQASDASSDGHKRAISMVVRAIVSGNPEAWPDKHPSSSAHWVAGMLSEDAARSQLQTRHRAQSTAVRPVSPRQAMGHSRASSEMTRGAAKDAMHVRHDSSITPRSPTRTPIDRVGQHTDLVQHESHMTFFLDDPAIDGISEPDNIGKRQSATSKDALDGESSVTLEELIDRLLSQPASKADGKLAIIFLALYRKFAPPGRLLDAMVRRFENLERNDGRNMIRTAEQLRHLNILEQWLGSYPGDFAHPLTRQKMRNFVSRISQSRIFAVAAKEMGTHLDTVKEDDDSHWAFSDWDDDLTRSEGLGVGGICLDEARDDLTIRSPAITYAAPLNEIEPSLAAQTLHASSQILLSAEAARRQAQLLHPTRRQALSKTHWRALMETSDDALARELTHMDWVLFAAARPRDSVRFVSLKKEEKNKYKNLVYVNMMSDHFNHLAVWAANFILLRDKPKHRALMLEKFMRVARRLRELNNYHSLGAIIAGVKSTAVYRLTATRELIPPTVGKDWMKLEILMGPSRSHFAYRLAWENTSGERIPYLPLHRRDLVSAEEGNKTFIDGGGDRRINWRKFEIMGEVIVDLQRAQGIPHHAWLMSRADPAIRDLILDIQLELDEDALYERSLQCEPAPTASGPSQKLKEFFKR